MNVTLLTFYLYIPFFGNSPIGQTPERILTRDGSKDAFSRKDVPFGVKNVEINNEPIFMPPNVKFWQKKWTGRKRFTLHGDAQETGVNDP